MKKELDLVKANDARVTALHGLDRMYAETLITYIRSHWHKDSEAIEDAIKDILIDLVTAQAEGIAAKAYFGTDPQTAADEIVRELPPATPAQWLMRLWPGLNGMGLLAMGGIVLTIGLGEGFNLMEALSWIGLFLLFMLVAPLFRGLDFNHLQRKTLWRLLLSLVVVIAAYVGLFWLPEVSITTPVACWLVGGVTGVLLLANAALAVAFRRLALPWVLAWLIGGGLALIALGLGLTLWASFGVALVVFGCGFGVELYQVSHLHVVGQMVR
ncbi:DUF1129 domain-containing protein [Lacticaseibacillus daqingensis]|uniref:hypothetical protein n=1 Tax=Lacticaseibacillus daqingensis TaxID=2486014 RepID=UPI000F7AD807|nr:hypothetical protein [Lacticaseibacillus daqingensis]